MSESTDEIGTLGPKDFAGIDKKFLSRSATVNAPARPLKGAPLVSKPDIVLPPEAELREQKLFPVLIKRSYRPMTSYFQIGEQDPDTGEITYRDPDPVEDGQDIGIVHQIPEETYAKLPVSEAREVIKRHIAERNDEMQA